VADIDDNSPAQASGDQADINIPPIDPNYIQQDQAQPNQTQQPQAQSVSNYLQPGQTDSQFIHTLTNPNADQMNQEALAWNQDIANRHITPETYGSLFAKQDTLGKIGLGISMLLSGAGSGLAHQQNAAMQIMNQAIDNDMKAQQQSKENANNFLRTAYDHEVQKSQSALNNAHVALTGEQLHGVDLDNQIKSQTKARNAMDIAAYNYALQQAGILPPAQQAAAIQTINNTIGQAVQNNVMQRNAQTADQLNARTTLRSHNETPASMPTQQLQGQDTGINQPLMQKEINVGRALENAHAPVSGQAISGQDLPEVNKEAQLVQDNRAIAKMYADSFQKLNNVTADQLQPNVRAAEVNSLGAEIARATAGRYNAQEATAQADALFPQASDLVNPEARAEKFRKTMQFFQAQEAATPTLNRLGLKTPFPNLSPTKQGADINAQAEAWAKANPDDPRAQKILDKLKGSQ